MEAMPPTISTRVMDLDEIRRAKPDLLLSGKPVPPWMTYTPPTPYLVTPCQVLHLPVREATVPGQK